jgi:hypothetical protein
MGEYNFFHNHPVSVAGGAVLAAVICNVPLDRRQRVEGKILHGQKSVF